jgi:uncharacterized membrane protein
MVGIALLWLFAIELFSVLSIPIAYRAFSRLPDRGYAFSKPLGLLLVGFGTWIIGLTHTIPNSRWTVLLAILMVGFVSWLAGRQIWPEIKRSIRKHVSVILAVELLFIAVFLGITLLRASITDISHTEQPMDFMFLNATITSPFYPPNDPWLAGEPVSYYYFGHLMIGAVTMLTGIAPAAAFNLGLATAAALGAAAAFGVTFNLIRLARGTDDGAVLGGLAATFLLLVASNLAGTLELVQASGAGGAAFWAGIGIDGLNPPDAPATSWAPNQFWWWFGTSRVTPGAITEFPFFSLLLGDLHPHVMSMGFVLMAMGVALQVYLQRRLLSIDLAGRVLFLSVAGVIGVWALAATLVFDISLTWIVALSALATTAAMGPLWPLGIVIVLTGGGLAAINLWDLPLGMALLGAAVLLNAVRNERALQFGSSVAISGDLMVAGAPTDSAAADRSGTAYVYVRHGLHWKRVARLLPTDPRPDAGFGTSIAVEEDHLVIGAPLAMGTGHAFVYQRVNDEWLLRMTLRPPDDDHATGFGQVVSLSGGTVAVSAHGAVYLFSGFSASWELEATLRSDTDTPEFGAALSLYGPWLAVGSPDAGSVSFFMRQEASWILRQRLVPETGTDLRRFGHSVSLEETSLAVGAKGSASVYRLHATDWQLEATLSSPREDIASTFGSSVAIERWYLTVGAEGGSAPKPVPGWAFIYASDGPVWTLHQEIRGRDLGGDSLFGTAVAMSGDTTAIGAPGSGNGAAFAYNRTLDAWGLQSKLIGRWRLTRALLAIALIGVGSLAAFLPFYFTFESSSNLIQPLRGLLTRPLHLLLLWGVPSLLVLPVFALILRRVFVRGNWSLMRLGIALYIGFTPLMFWLQPVYAGPLYAIGLVLFGLHQAGYRMPGTDEMLFAYNPRATLMVGAIIVLGGFVWDGVVNGERGINNEVVALDRLLIVVPIAFITSLAIYGAWTLAHRDSEELRTAGPAHADTKADAFVPILMMFSIAAALVMGVELFHLSDSFRGGDLRRMNTVFKATYQAWLIMAVLGGFGLWYVGSRWDRSILPGRLGVTAWVAILLIGFGAVSYYPLAGVASRTGDGNGLDLNGLAHVERDAPDEYRAIQWIRDNVARDAVVVESPVIECPSDSNGCGGYNSAARISASTGRPTILGWAGHERQWRTVATHPQIDQRLQDVRTIYETPIASDARLLLESYEADYIVIGMRERQMYGTGGIAKFGELGQRVFPEEGATSDVVIYRLRLGDET